MTLKLTSYGTREIIVISVIFGVFFLSLLAYLPYAAPVPLVLLVAVLSFFRDPDRTLPKEEDVLASPADGTVMDIKELNAEETDYMNENCVRIGIFLSVLNVHVNRASVSGTVTNCEYREGAFHTADSERASEDNESNYIEIKHDNGFAIGIRQIAGAVARRIVCSLEQGDQVERGERLGMIKFGSRTELYVPGNLNPDVLVSEGDQVKGASTGLVRLEALKESDEN